MQTSTRRFTMASSSVWEGTPAVTFEHVQGSLQARGWPNPNKLRTLNDTDPAHLVKVALEEFGEDVDEDLYDALSE